MSRQYTANFLHWLASNPDLHRGAAMVRREEMQRWPMGSWEWQRQLRALKEHEEISRE